MSDDPSAPQPDPLVQDSSAEASEIEGTQELPVVARMVVEIRSDGSRTVARGAVEDLLNDQQVAVEARADSPLELSRALAKMLFSAPFAASSALLRGPGKDLGDDDSPAEVVDAEPHSSRARGLRGRVGALGQRLGRGLSDRVNRELQKRLLGDLDGKD